MSIVMSDARAMGIIFPNMHDDNIPELISHRTMASVPFAGRYRMIDFSLSRMAAAGMRSIGVIVRQNYQSLMGHLGSGREWDLARKRGGLVIFPPYGREGGKSYYGRLQGLDSVIEYMESRNEKLVVMSDCDIACNIDCRRLIAEHVKSGADVTAVYEKGVIQEGMRGDNVCFTLGNDGLVNEVRINDYKRGTQNISMNIYVIGREFLVNSVKEAMVRGDTSFERDILGRSLNMIKVVGYECTDYRARIYDMRSYFTENLRLLERGNLEALFPIDRPVYTKVRDEAPVRYAIGSRVVRSMASDGCIIEGEVTDSLVFRGVRIGKGAKIKNCVIMQGTVIEPNVTLENVICDKNVLVKADQALKGAADFPVYIRKDGRVGE